MVGKSVVFILLLISVSTSFARVPPRTNIETEEAPADTNSKEGPIQVPVERSPIDSFQTNNENPADRPRSNKKPISVILFRTHPAISFLRDRSPFQPMSPSFDHPHFSNFGNSGFNNGGFGSDGHDDPALRLISLIFGNRLRPMNPESTPETEPVNESGETDDSSEHERRHPFETLFPNIFVPRLDDFDKEQPATEDKTPDNFENKENKVITIGDKKYVKTTQVKKVKNDFGSFHSVISSYQPFDEKIHDENGNEKIKPSESDNKEVSVDKKDVESSTASSSTTSSSTAGSSPSSTGLDEKVDSSTPLIEKVDSVEPSTSAPEKEESTRATETSSPKPNEKLIAENLSKEVSKNEIPDKNTEMKVDQMN